MTEKTSNSILFKFIEFISTFFYVGKLKFCPGTWGSIATLPLWLSILSVSQEQIANNVYIVFCYWLLILFLITALGIYAIGEYINVVKRDDPSEVVIDEVVGQLLAFILTSITFLILLQIDFTFLGKLNLMTLENITSLSIFICFLLLILPIAFFRLFDIKKPWLVGIIDSKYHNKWGIMFDDVIAGLFAGISCSLILIIIFII